MTDVERICLAALDRPAEERAAFLEEACQGDDALRREIESLLAQASSAEHFIEHPAVARAGALAGLGSLSPGQRLGPYHVVARLGVGGMGEVYRARDTQLGREVAIKILPVVFAADPDRLARFEREARILASLNHPHIAAIYGVETDPADDGVPRRALVMELIEGPTLAERILRGPLPLAEVLPVARQIAEALEAAHEQGIVHRDLKPANIKIRPDGTVKVLDFGLAKADAAPADVRHPQSHVTKQGVILGTAAYMSPEQSRGEAVDKRTDIWAFGCVLFEMLAGRPVFAAASVTETLSEVLKTEPDWQRLPGETPAGVRRLLRRCLTKDRARRLADIRDAHFDLDEPASDVLRDARRVGWHVSSRWAIAGIAAVIAIGVLIWSATGEPPRIISRLVMPLPEGQQFTYENGQAVAMSPDATNVVYVANQRLYRRPMGDFEAYAIPGGEGDVSNPVFSPDGPEIAYYSVAERALKRLPIAGGTPFTIAKNIDRPYGFSWGEQGIVYSQIRTGIFLVPSAGGVPRTLVQAISGEIASSPQMLPGGSVLFSVRRRVIDQDLATRTGQVGSVVVQSPDGVRKRLVEGLDGRYLPTGHLVYVVSGDLFAVRFDLASLSVIGEGVRIVEGIRRSTLIASPQMAQFSYSATGSMAFLPGPSLFNDVNVDLAQFDRKGESMPLGLLPRPYRSPRASPDGKSVAFETEDASGVAAVWVYELAGGKPPRQLTSGGKSRYPIWSHDSQWVLFQSERGGHLGIFRQRADGVGIAEPLTKPEGGTEHVPQSFSKGDQLLFSVFKDKVWSLWTLSLKDRKEAPFGDVHSTGLVEGEFSPEGQWVVYRESSEAATSQVFLQPFPATGEIHPVRKGSHVYWSSSRGDELIVNGGPGESFVIPVIRNRNPGAGDTTTPRVTFGQERRLPRGARREGPWDTRREVDSMPDGEHVIGVMVRGGESLLPQINIVLNWFDDVRQRVPRQ